MTTGSLRAISFQVRSLITGKVESIMIETAYSELGDLSGQGWAAALNGFDQGNKLGYGKTEAIAIAELLERCDLERIVDGAE